jgi:D-3-phosphoglycerate dehydrogenase
MPTQYKSILGDIAVAVERRNDTPGELTGSLSGADAIIASARIRYDGAFMDQVPTLRVISRTGIGIDNISLADATERGIAICNSPDGPSASTAEHAITLMLCSMKQLNRWDQTLRLGEKLDFFNEYRGMQAEGTCLGVVGLGRIGSRVARIGKALGMQVIGYDPYLSGDSAATLGITIETSLEALLPAVDVLSLHLPVTDSTYHIMNGERLAMMKQGSILINTARGGLVDEPALIAVLDSGHLAGAGLDVFDPEPPDSSNPLLQRDNVIATPHIGGATVQSKDRLWREAIEQALQVLRGERPPNLVNGEVWHRQKRV